jgi:hypothetical protein
MRQGPAGMEIAARRREASARLRAYGDGLSAPLAADPGAASLSAPARLKASAAGGIDARAGADNPSGRGDPLRGASSLLVADRLRKVDSSSLLAPLAADPGAARGG